MHGPRADTGHVKQPHVLHLSRPINDGHSGAVAVRRQFDFLIGRILGQDANLVPVPIKPEEPGVDRRWICSVDQDAIFRDRNEPSPGPEVSHRHVLGDNNGVAGYFETLHVERVCHERTVTEGKDLPLTVQDGECVYLLYYGFSFRRFKRANDHITI